MTGAQASEYAKEDNRPRDAELTKSLGPKDVLSRLPVDAQLCIASHLNYPDSRSLSQVHRWMKSVLRHFVPFLKVELFNHLC